MVLDLGTQPLANSFVRPEALSEPEPRYPLELCRCEACGHVQLSLTVPPEVMFRDYLYVSGTSDTIPAHFAAYAAEVAERFVAPGDLVVEIGSNDGTLLRAFDRVSVRVLGVEPARNVAAIANAAGVPTLDEFFNETIARTIVAEHGTAAAIIGNNVVAHIDDLHGLLRGVKALLADRGVFIAANGAPRRPWTSSCPSSARCGWPRERRSRRSPTPSGASGRSSGPFSRTFARAAASPGTARRRRATPS